MFSRISLFLTLISAWFPLLADAQLYRGSPKSRGYSEQARLVQIRRTCQAFQADYLTQREEIASIKNGYIWQDPDLESPAYLIHGFDRDTKTFVTIQGQRLGAGIPLKLPISLPRDASSCRIVSTTDGKEFLELKGQSLNPSAAAEMENALVLLDTQASVPRTSCEVSMLNRVATWEVILKEGLAQKELPCSNEARAARFRAYAIFKDVF